MSNQPDHNEEVLEMVTDTNQASELFELCQKVYKLTSWKDTRNRLDDGNYTIRNEGNEVLLGSKQALLYTSDYLLEKLPGYIALTSTTWDDVHVYKKDSELDYQACACYQSNVKGKLIQRVADTPLKALLKLTIALSEAGELK